jgi:hypothetical protein
MPMNFISARLRNGPRVSLRAAAVAGVALALCACSSHTYRTVDLTPPGQLQENIPEQQLLDVGIAVFDANVPDDYDARERELINAEVRRAESYYMPYVLKNVLESSGNWGAVRMVPRTTHAVDLLVSGRILTSHGERLALAVTVTDSRGVVWFSKSYKALGSRYAYEATLPQGIDPFQQLYTQIADDMAQHFAALSAEERQTIRTIAEMQFARDMVAVAYDGYVTSSPTGTVELTRLPAADDPMMRSVRKVRDREFMFIDTLDGYYAEYSRRIQPTYQTWRKATYGDAIARLTITEQKQGRSVVGVLGIVGGLLGGPATFSAVAGGADLLKDGVRRTDAALMHGEALREISEAMEGDVVPHTITLENETLQLTGTIDRQYAQLRRILRDAYLEEFHGIGPARANSAAIQSAGGR